MATTAEVLAIEQLHQAAQARLGIAAAYLALAEWESVDTVNAESTSALWLVASIRIITAVRKMSRQLAIAYYQLVRALETGSTLGEPPGSTGDVTIGDLRTSFRDIALDVASLPSPRTPSADPDIRWFEEELKATDMPSPQTPGRLIRLSDAEVDPLIQNLLDVEDSVRSTDPVSVDAFEWEPELSRQEVDELFRELLRKQAVKRAADKARALRSSTELSPDQVLTQLEESHAVAGSLGSGTVDALGVEGGRQAIDKAIRKDKRIKLVARGTGPDPCAFCAMLASRGFVYTGSTSGVGDDSLGEEIEKYHINCHCYAIVRFVNESSTLPDTSLYFREKWYEVTDGYSGHDKAKAFRRWMYAQRKATKTT